MNNIILAFDFGIKKIGVAVGQHVTSTASPLTTIKVQRNISHWFSIKCLLEEWQPDKIIVGLPLNMNGTEQLITICARKFANKISNYFSIVVKFHDERLTTMEARSWIFNYSGFRALSKKNIDSISAAIILESYLRQNV